MKYSGDARTNLICSRTSFVIACVLSSTHWNLYIQGNPFLPHSLERSYHQTQPFKEEKYNTKSEICVKISQKKNIKQATTSKTNLLGTNALLGPSK
jgi:hypothetical protein